METIPATIYGFPRTATARDTTGSGILASKIITMLDPQQALLVNRNKIGSMALAGESLFVLETPSASCVIPAANEGREGGPDRAGRRPDDRRHRPALPVRLRGRGAAGRRGRRRAPGT